MFVSLEKIFRNLSEWLSILFEGLGNATFLDYVLMIVLVIVLLFILSLITHYLKVLVYAFFGFQLKITKTKRYDESFFPSITKRINDKKEAFELQQSLQNGLRTISSEVKDLREEQNDQLYTMDQQVLSTYTGTKGALKQLNNNLQVTNNQLSDLSNSYNEFLKMYDKMRQELDQHQKGIDYSKNTLLFKKILFLANDIYGYEMDVAIKDMIISNIKNLLADYGIYEIKVSKGTMFDPSVHQVVSNVPTDSTQNIGRVAIVKKLGFTINNGIESKVLEPAKVAVFKAKGGM